MVSIWIYKANWSQESFLAVDRVLSCNHILSILIEMMLTGLCCNKQPMSLDVSVIGLECHEQSRLAFIKHLRITCWTRTKKWTGTRNYPTSKVALDLIMKLTTKAAICWGKNIAIFLFSPIYSLLKYEKYGNFHQIIWITQKRLNKWYYSCVCVCVCGKGNSLVRNILNKTQNIMPLIWKASFTHLKKSVHIIRSSLFHPSTTYWTLISL